MKSVKASLPGKTPVQDSRRDQLREDEDEEDDTPVQQVKRTRGGWLNYFSVDAMGLADYVDENTPGLPFSTLTNLFSGLGTDKKTTRTETNQDGEIADNEDERAEAERMYLTYSWWLLHQGWEGVADRVDRAVGQVFSRYGSQISFTIASCELLIIRLPIKRELSSEDWQNLFKEARAIIETENGEGGPKLYE